jgi:hypothetical protein
MLICLFNSQSFFKLCLFVCLMGLNTTFNNISVISWQSVLLMEETEVPGENHRPVASYWQTLSNNVVHLPWSIFALTTWVVEGTDCIDSCKSNYCTITAMTAHNFLCNLLFVWLYYCYQYNDHHTSLTIINKITLTHCHRPLCRPSYLLNNFFLI